MKVTCKTPNQLILSNRPWLIGIMLVFFILCFVGAGLSMIAEGDRSGIFVALFGGGMGFIAFCVFVRRVQVILDRKTDSILIRRQSIFGYETVRHVLSNLSHAEVETTTSNGNNGSSTMHRPVLILDQGMSAGRHPIVSAYVSGHGSHRMVDAVNDWLPARAVDSDDQSA